MANHRPEIEREQDRARALHVAAKLFLEKGYTRSSIREIAKLAGINVNTLVRDFGCKENILCELVVYTMNGQFDVAGRMLEGITDDKILFYAVETTLQLYMTELNEPVRELYSTAYSLPKTSEMIQNLITEKLEGLFKAYMPDADKADFFELEVASGGIMRSFMIRHCDMYFTMERKVSRFLASTFKIYDVPQEKIQETIAFVKQFDFPLIAQQTIASLLDHLE